jgi:hypothetical protein
MAEVKKAAIWIGVIFFVIILASTMFECTVEVQPMIETTGSNFGNYSPSGT